MAIKYQFNKISMQALQKQLKVRVSALPTLKSKESALRLTVKREREALTSIEAAYRQKMAAMEDNLRLWAEFPGTLYELGELKLDVKKIAGVKTPLLSSMDSRIEPYSAFMEAGWTPQGLTILKEISELLVRIEIARKRIQILEYARKKTTQKVNLYEKVQIPLYSEAVLKIKRYLEDVDNLEKAAQKITRDRQGQAEVTYG